MVIARFVSLALALAACKGAPEPVTASGPPTAVEERLLAHMPNDVQMVFGGTLAQASLLIDGPLARVVARLDPSSGLADWTACFVSLPGATIMLGSSPHGQVIAADGIRIEQLEGCARKALFTAQVDADRRFIAITGNGRVRPTLGYLVLGDGTILQAQRAASRSELELLATAGRADHKHLRRWIERADRSHLWLAGKLSGHRFHAAIVGDRAKQVAIDVTLDGDDDSGARDLAREVSEMARSRELGRVVDDLDVSRDGREVRARARIDLQELAKLAR